MKIVFEYQNYQMLGLNWTHVSNFHPLEVMGSDSETQLEVG